MSEYFGIHYETDRMRVAGRIADRLTRPGSDYICVADGVIADRVWRDSNYRETVNGGMFSICDSGYVPLYVRLIHGHRIEQYTGSEIFADIVSSRRWRMAFLGTHTNILEALRTRLSDLNPDVKDMLFKELPFCNVEDFDYAGIARMIECDGAEIIWVALGAPKQEEFMRRLKPHLHHGVMIAVGAAFKFYSGVDVRRAPAWMIRCHLEFVHRLCVEPRKQARRCLGIITSLPAMLAHEWHSKRKKSNI